MRALLVAAALAVAPATAAADPATSAVLARMPGDTAMVASLDVAELRKTSAFRRVPSELRQRVQRFGIERAWVAMPASAFGGGAGGKRIVMAMTTTLTADRFLGALRGEGKPVEKKAHGRTYYAVGDHGWAYIDGTILVASHDLIEGALAAPGTGARAAVDDPALAAGVAAAERGGGHAWLAMVLPESMRGEIRKQPMAAAFAEVRWIAAHASMGKGARYGLEIRAATAGDATSIAALCNMAIQMMGKDQAFLKGVSFRSDEASVRVDGQVSSAELDGFFAVLGR